VEVDRAPCLVLSDLAERHPHHPVKPTPGDPGELGQGALGVLGGAPPQLRCQRVPEHLADVVEAVAADRLAQAALAVAVPLPAAHGAAVRAALVEIPRPAGQQLPAAVAALGVDGAEAGRGKGHEQPRVRADRVGEALATAQAGGDELPGVAAVGLRAGRADALAAVAAGLEQHAAGFVVGGVDLADLAGGGVGLVDAASEADRVGAVVGAADLGQPVGQPGRILGWFGELVVLGQAPRVGGPNGPNSSRHARTTSVRFELIDS
jgi:hypothetical protein